MYKNMKKIVVYARISTTDQNIESQIDSIHTYCKKNEYEIVDTFQDIITGSSKATEREGFQQLLNFLNINNEVKNLICYEYSRLGRSFIDTYTIIEHFKNKGVNIYFEKENLNTLNTTPDDNLRLNMLSSIAEYERTQIKERTRRGRIYKIQNQGAPSGSLPQFGYTKHLGKLVIDTEEAKIIKEIFSLYVNKKYSTPEIAKKLNRDNVKTKYRKQVDANLIEPKNRRLARNQFVWTDGSVARLLRKSILTGHRQYVNLDLPYNQELQIIDDETFNLAQSRLSGQKKVNPNASKFENVLRGCIKCSCGYNYLMQKGNDSNAHHYKCANKECKAPNIDIDLINNVVYFFLKSATRDDEKLSAKTKEIEEKIKDIETTNNSIKETIKKTKTQISVLYEDRLNGVINADVFSNFNKGLTDIITTHEEKLHKNIKAIENHKQQIENYKKSAEYNYNNPEIFKKYIKETIQEISITKLEKNPTLKEIFPLVRHSSILKLNISAGIFGYHECIVNYNHNYFLTLIGNCFDDNNNFIGGSITEHNVMNEDDGLAELVKEITPMYIKANVPDAIKI